MVRKLPYDTLTAMEFVAKIGESFLVLSVNPSLPVKSVKDLLALAKAKPDGYTLMHISVAFAINPSTHKSLLFDSIFCVL